ncbi:MAG TPA: serine/threonine-protein kinase [Polyangia bacterium]
MASKVTSVRDARAASSTSGRIDEASLIGLHVGDRYRLRELIGEGGMGGVFRAEQLATGRLVALKLLHPELAHIDYVARRFEREAQVASRLSHPNIVDVFDFGESNGHLYIAMELLAGTSLGDAIARGAFARGNATLFGRARRLLAGHSHLSGIPPTIAIVRQVLAALEHAHARGVVHRDLKPDNIMLLPPRDDSSPAHVKLLDFGIAKLADEAPRGGKPLTQAGVPLGTPEYMSPEQAAGDATDARSDLYACGIILYEMLTGRLPFEAESAVRLLSMQITAVPPPPRAVAPDAHIPAALEEVVLRALAKKREDRFDSATELLHALDDAVAAASPSGDAPSGAPAARAPRYGHPRSRRIVVGALALGLAAFVLADHHGAAAPAPVVAAAPIAADAGKRLERTRVERLRKPHAR